MRTALALFAVALLVLPATGCAWANRDNRPVWNAFEEHVVPEGDAAFYAALPLTVPGGLVAIVLDTFVVHPAQVVDDAAGDAAELWEQLGPKFEEHYYTQMAVLPFRAVLTPLAFVGSFLGRSLFDIDPHGGHDPGTLEARRQDRERQRAQELLAMLQAVADGRGAWDPGAPPEQWSAELRDALAAALAAAGTEDRVTLLVYALDHRVPDDVIDPRDGLGDPDPVFRYLLLRDWPSGSRERIPADVRAALRQDPSPAVRDLAARLGI